MKKGTPLKKLMIISLLVLVLLLAGCLFDKTSPDRISGRDRIKDNRFVDTGDTYSFYSLRNALVIYDSKTNIVYLLEIGSGGLSVLYNSQGLPMTYDEYLETR